MSWRLRNGSVLDEHELKPDLESRSDGRIQARVLAMFRPQGALKLRQRLAGKTSAGTISYL
jgi:hypothetical protein